LARQGLRNLVLQSPAASKSKQQPKQRLAFKQYREKDGLYFEPLDAQALALQSDFTSPKERPTFNL
jgi:hypothetical protein